MYIDDKTKVHQLMAKRVIVGNLDNTAYEAYKLFQEYNLHHLPIVDKDEKLVGIVSSNDLIKNFSSIAFEANDFNKEKLNKELKLSDIMTKNPITMGPDDLIKDMVVILDEKGFNSILVTDEDDKIVGIVTSKDLVHFLNLLYNKLDKLSRGSFGR